MPSVVGFPANYLGPGPRFPISDGLRTPLAPTYARSFLCLRPEPGRHARRRYGFWWEIAHPRAAKLSAGRGACPSPQDNGHKLPTIASALSAQRAIRPSVMSTALGQFNAWPLRDSVICGEREA